MIDTQLQSHIATADIQDLEVEKGLTELSKNYAASIDGLTLQISAANQAIKDGLAADEEYKALDEQIKALQKKRIIVKKEAMARQNLIAQQEQLKDLKKDRKEKKESLSEYLLELQKMTGITQMELFDGRVYNIKKNAKLVKPPKKEWDKQKE